MTAHTNSKETQISIKTGLHQASTGTQEPLSCLWDGQQWCKHWGIQLLSSQVHKQGAVSEAEAEDLEPALKHLCHLLQQTLNPSPLNKDSII